MRHIIFSITLIIIDQNIPHNTMDDTQKNPISKSGGKPRDPSTKLGASKPRGKHIAVIGAGISGLTCAYELQRAGFDVEIFEKNAL